MKRIILLVFMMLPMMAMAQIPQFTKLIDKYNGAEGVTAMNLNKHMIAMFAWDNKDFDFADEINILLSDNSEVAKAIVKDAKKAVKRAKVKLLIEAIEDGSTYSVYTKTKNNVITNIVLIIENDTPSGFALITGEIPEEKLSEVIKIVTES